MVTSSTDNKHPYYKDISKLGSKKAAGFFTGDNSFRMRFVSLGEALDFTSFGGMNYVVWEMDPPGMIKFIQSWMDAQKPRVEWERIPVEGREGVYNSQEKSREYGYMWNKFYRDRDENLPSIHFESCPRSGTHSGVVKDLAGRTRCSYVPGPRKGPCFSIISENGISLPLESVLSRLDVSGSFLGNGDYSIFPLDGFTLANYVKGWWNQEGEKKLFLRKGEKDNYKIYPNFRPISSDD